MNRHPDFPLQDDLIYMNHAAISPWPVGTAEAIKDFVNENLHSGSSHYLQWIETETSLRERLKTLINAESKDDIALLKNTSEGLSVIAYGLDFQQGDNIVIAADEFPSNRVVWQSLQNQGVHTREVNIHIPSDPEQALIDACDDNTRLISVSAVHYSSGLRLDLVKMGRLCQQRDILLVVDAIQQLGALKFDQQAIQADFIVADGHKWMMAPEGLALFYCKPELREHLKLNQYGWHMIKNPSDFTQHQWEVVDTAQRFECGSPNMIGCMALHASLGFIEQTGMDVIERAILDHTRLIRDYIINSGSYSLSYDLTQNQLSGITNFKHQGISNEDLFKKLTDERVQCAMRGAGIRLSPHFYHQPWEFERLFVILDKLA